MEKNWCSQCGHKLTARACGPTHALRKAKYLRGQHRCQALDAKGKQCRKMTDKTTKYHGDGELYGYWNESPQWVKVYLCDGHTSAQGEQ